ncbi:MAG: aminotransferase class V-fold PLP-dependent enzyme [Actinobacteria bacterium]|nr:aminotransferase class V-fold PLP-dependent enzyme [Actinomycetota bacterium]
MTFDEARAQFPVLERCAYLNAGTFGPMSHAVAGAIAAEQQRALEEGRINRAAFVRYLEDRLLVREGFARLLGVPVENIALTTSTSEGCNVVLNGLGLGADDEIVTTDSEHFGLIGPLVVSPATVRVARIRNLPAADAYETILAEVGPRTKLIALSEVLWITGHRLPWRELRAATGVPVLVDGAQSAGAIPVDATEADFYTVSAQKWLCGPDLTGALSVRDPDSIRLAQPSYLSQREYDLAQATFEPHEGAARFDTHFTPLAATAGLLAAFELHPAWRFERGAEASARCRELLAERAEVVTEPGHANLVAFRDADPEATVARLAEAGVIVRDLPSTGFVRVSCGWWTSDEDLGRLVATL